MLIVSQPPSATTNRPTAAKEPASYSSMHATSDQPAFEAIIHTPRRAFNRPSSARGRIERVRSSSRCSADNSAARSGSQLGDAISPVSEATLFAAPPRVYMATDVSVLSSAILNKRFDSQFANLRVHVEYSAYLVSTGHSLRYDPEKYKACFADLEQLAETRSAAVFACIKHVVDKVYPRVSLFGMQPPLLMRLPFFTFAINQKLRTQALHIVSAK